jgi:hypothetical protein
MYIPLPPVMVKGPYEGIMRILECHNFLRFFLNQ